MKKLILIFITLLIAVWAGVKIAVDPGYVLLAYHKTTVEMPLWLFVFSAILSFGFLYAVCRILSNTFSAPQKFKSWRSQHQLHKSHTLTSQGLVEFNEGNWQLAEKHLMKAQTHSHTPLINYLAAARAAQHQGNIKARDKYLQQAQKKMPQAQFSISVTQAELQLYHGQFEQALALLKHLHQAQPRHKRVLSLLVRVYVALKDWSALRDVLPQAEKLNIINHSELHELHIKIYSGLLHLALLKPNADGLIALWHSFPKRIKHDEAMITEYAECLIQKDDHANAEILLKSSMKSNYNNKFIKLLGTLTLSDPDKTLKFMEGFLNKHQDDPSLLLTLGRICITNQLWGKAKTYLENALALRKDKEHYTALATLLEKLGETNRAYDLYKEALAV